MGVVAQVDTTTGKVLDQKSTEQAAHTYEQGATEGGRNADSATNSYLVNRPEVNYTAVATGQTDSAVSAGAPAHLVGLIVTAQGASNSITIKDGATTIYTITPGAVGAVDLGNYGAMIRFETSIVITTGANESCVVYWRPI